MHNIEHEDIFKSKKLLFTSGSLAFGFEERADMIDYHKRELLYVCRQLKSFKKDVGHIISNRMPLSMVSNLAYNLDHILVSCYVGLTVYEYLTTAYLLSEDYNDNYRLWKIYTKFAKEVEDLIAKLSDENVFNLGEEPAVENLMPPFNTQKNAVRSLLNLEHKLSEINGDGLFHALTHYLRAIGNRLEKIKIGLNDLTDDDFETIYSANYNYYKETYWPSEVKIFRQFVEDNYFHRKKKKVETLEDLLWDDKSQFKNDVIGRLWQDYFYDKKVLYFEMRRAKINEEQWKYFFKNICKFEEYERWIYELEHPNVAEKVYPISDWDKIFKGAIDVVKVKIIIPYLLADDFTKPKLFVLHKVLEEIDWLQDCADTHFLSWIEQVYELKNTPENFKSINKRLKEEHTLDWDINTMTSASISKSYIDLANKIRKEFVLELDGKVVVRDNKNYFLKPNLYIEHKIKL